MGERKVLNKYYPPDFDPSKLPRRKNPKNHQMKIRTMLPMSIRCKTCGTFISKGTKFNSRTEEVAADKYLGEIKVLRFYIKCTNCAAEITFKTDPQNDDYVVESGATRNFDGFEDESEASEKKRRRVDAEDCGEANREAKCWENKREMESYAALNETLHLKSMHEKAGSESALRSLKSRDAEKKRKEEEEDEALVKTIVFRNSKDYVWRIGGDDDDDEDWG